MRIDDGFYLLVAGVVFYWMVRKDAQGIVRGLHVTIRLGDPPPTGRRLGYAIALFMIVGGVCQILIGLILAVFPEN